jgi:hypothetical protein
VFCGAFAADRVVTRRTPNLPAGRYYLFVEAADVDAFALAIEPLETPPNDTCATAAPLVFQQGRATVVADTTLASHDLDALPCTSATGNDLVYRFTLGAPARVVASTDADWDTVLALRRDPCNSSQGNIQCNDDFGMDTTSQVEANLEAGTYYLLVDGFWADAFGPVTLRVTVDPPGSVLP